MANVMDYLDWRGDLSFLQSPFNEVDNLLLSKLCFVDLTGIVPAPGEPGSVPLPAAADEYFSRHGYDEPLGLLIPADIHPMFRKMAGSVRFGELALSSFVNRVDEVREEQFSALTASLPDGTKYVAFRGTDDNIVAWKENFCMSVNDAVPAQTDAAAYLHGVALEGPEPLRVGGHSKGGNLAVYAAVHCVPEVQARILRVYNNDGPGFRDSVTEHPGYDRVCGRITTLVPQSSVVGMLLTHSREYEVVHSTQSGPFQHNGFSWEVLGTSFVRRADLTVGGRLVDRTVKAWADNLTLEQRREFVDAFFGVLTSAGARTLSDLNEHRMRMAVEIAKNWKQLKPETHKLLSDTLNLLLKESVRSVSTVLPKAPRTLEGAIRVVRRVRRGKKEETREKET